MFQKIKEVWVLQHKATPSLDFRKVPSQVPYQDFWKWHKQIETEIMSWCFGKLFCGIGVNSKYKTEKGTFKSGQKTKFEDNIQP